MFSGGDILSDKCKSDKQCSDALTRVMGAVTDVCTAKQGGNAEVAALDYCGDPEKIPGTFAGLHPEIQDGLKDTLPGKNFLQPFGVRSAQEASAMYDNIMAGKGVGNGKKANGKKAPASQAPDLQPAEATNGVTADGYGNGFRLRFMGVFGSGMGSTDGGSSNNPYGDIGSSPSQARGGAGIGALYGWKTGSWQINAGAEVLLYIAEEETDPYGNRQRPNPVIKPYAVAEAYYMFGDASKVGTRFGLGAALHFGGVFSFSKDLITTPGWATRLAYFYMGIGPAITVQIPTDKKNKDSRAIELGLKFMYAPRVMAGVNSQKDMLFGNQYVQNTYETWINQIEGVITLTVNF